MGEGTFKAVVLWFLALALCGASPRPPALYPTIGGVYETTAVNGEVRVWRRFGTNWTSVAKGDRLAQGELLQLSAASSLRVRGVVSGVGEQVPRGFMIKTEEPLVTRLEEISLRSLELGGYFIPMDRVTGKDEKKEDVKPPEMRSAWERMVSIFDEKSATDEAQSDLGAGLGGGDQNAKVDDAHEIVIDHPRSGDTYIVETLPTEVAVSWSKLPVGVKSVRVFFWRNEHGSPVPVGQTEETFFRLRVLAGGRYYVRVESPDGRWRSKSHLFIMLTPDLISTQKEPKSK